MLLASALAGGCTEMLLGGKNYHLDEGAGGTGGADDTGPAACENGFTACDGACVLLDSDAEHCGACGHDCFGATCNAGMCAPQEVAAHLTDPRAVAVDETHVYWTDAVTLQRAPKDGGAAETLSAGHHELGAVAVDDKYVFWLDQGSGTVMKLKKDGNGKAKVVFDGSKSDNLGSLAFDGEDVYFSRTVENGDIRRAKKGMDEVPTVLVGAQPEPTDIRMLGAGLMWSGFMEELQGRPDGAEENRVAPVGGYVRFTLRKGAAGFTALAEGEGEITALAAAGDVAVWVDGTSARIRARSITDPAPITLVEGQHVAGLSADDTRIYWSTKTGTVKSHVLTSHETRTLAVDIAGAGPVALDATHVYILRTGPDGGILRVAR